MHILVLNHNFRGQGTYWRAIQFARQFHRRGNRVTVMCVAPDKRYRARRSERDGFALFETPHWAPGLDPQEGWGPLDVIFRMVHAARGHVDLAYSFSHKLNCTAPARAARLRHGCPWITDWCDWWGGPEGLFRKWVVPSRGFQSLPAPIRAWRQLFFRLEEGREEGVRHSADLITVISSALADRARRLGARPERICQVSSGAPTDMIQPGDKAEARSALGLPEKAFIIGHMANMHLDEDLLLGALRLLLEGLPEARLLVVGPAFDHPGEHLSPEQQSGSVTVLGHITFEEIATPLAAADVWVLPLSECQYNRGRWPNKIGDYLAAGRPVVATDVGDAAALVREHSLGWVCEPTAEALALSLAEAWDHRTQWPEIGRRARRFAESDLSWDTLTEHLIEAVRREIGLDLTRG